MKVDVVICEKCDDDLKVHTNVFSNVEISGDRLSFTIVTKVEFGPEDLTSDSTILHYFLLADNGMGVYLYEAEITNPEGNGKISADKQELKDILMPYNGTYTLNVIKNNEYKDCKAEEGPDAFAKGELIAETSFILTKK